MAADPISAALGGGGGLSNQTASNARSGGDQGFEGSFGAAWNVATGSSKVAASGGLDVQTLMIVAAAVVVGMVILKRKG